MKKTASRGPARPDLRPQRHEWIQHRRRKDIADIQSPDLETKIAILKKKAETEAVPLPEGRQIALVVIDRLVRLRVEEHLRRQGYTIVRDVATLFPMVAPLGFTALPGDPTELDGISYYAGLLDFGPSSIDGWLSALVAAELRIDEDSILDVAQHDRRVELDQRQRQRDVGAFQHRAHHRRLSRCCQRRRK